MLAIAVLATVAFRLAARIWPGVDHRATVTAINAGGTSKRRTTSFKIVKPNRRR